MTLLSKFIENEDGATAIEYGLIAALVGVAIIAGAQTLGQQLDNTFDKVSNALSSATTAANN